MQLTMTNDYFIALDTSILDHDFLRKIGFAYDRSNKYWLTPFASVAEKVIHRLDTDISEAIHTKKRKELKKRLESTATFSSVHIPAPLGLHYLPFQKPGIEFIANTNNVLLADEMGLGKTVQSIGYLNLLPYKLNSILIICPTSLKLNWAKELTKWLIHNYDIGIANSKFFPETDIIIINYDILIKLSKHIHEKQWDLLILDECQYLKNNKAKRTKEVIGFRGKGAIQAKKKLALTGTPILNRPIELYNIVNFLNPFAFPNKFNYALKYCDAQQTRWGWNTTGASNLKELQYKLRSSFMIRRKKEDVLQDLPPKIRQIIEIKPTPKCMKLIKEERGYFEGLRLKELKDDDVLYQEVIHRIKGVRAGFEDMARLRHEYAVAKTPLCVDYIKDVVEDQEKVVVFFWHKEVGVLLKEEFMDEAVLLVGDTPLPKREKAVKSFQEDKKIKVFLGNIQAAGVGITLTAAQVVIFVEFSWVPGEMCQAEDRLHRIGQKGNVLVQHLVLSESLDANMCRAVIHKQKIIESAINHFMDKDIKEALQ